MKSALRVLLSLLVAALLVAVLVRWGGVDRQDLERAWSAITWRALAAAAAVYALQYLLRAWRFHLLIPRAARPSYACSLSVTAAYGMATLILPAKLGEASFVVYLNRAGGVSASEALAALVVGRLLDFAGLFFGFGVACTALAASGARPELAWLGPIGALLLVLAALALLLSARGDLLVSLAARLSRRAGLTRWSKGQRLLARIESLGTAMRLAGTGGNLWAAAWLTLPMWACVFVFCAVLAHGFGLPPSITFAEACFGASLAILTSILPLSAFANFGTLETGWVLGFGVLGVSRELAFATGTGLHIVQLGCALVLGLFGHLGMGLVARARPGVSAP